MKFATKLILLSSILLVLIILYVIGFILDGRSSGVLNQALLSEQAFGRLRAVRFLPAPDETGEEVSLRERTGAWTFTQAGNEFPADMTKINNLLEALESARLLRRVTDSAELWPQFELDEDTASRLLLLDGQGETVREFYFGKVGLQGNENYIRIAGDGSVYLASTSLDFYLRQPANYWADLAIFPEQVTSESIVSISLTSDPGNRANDELLTASYQIFQSVDEGAATWLADDGTQLDQEKIRDYRRSLADLKAAEFVTEASGFDEPYAEIELILDTGEEHRLIIGDQKGESNFYARYAGRFETYSISKWSVDRVVLPLDELLPERTRTYRRS